tara:strand:- start:171 stop:398 length:228 start_codon:yes stop_codon:yes gene_type:complete
LVVVEVELILTQQPVVVQVVEEQDVLPRYLTQEALEQHVKVIQEKPHPVLLELVVVAVEKAQVVALQLQVDVVLM